MLIARLTFDPSVRPCSERNIDTDKKHNCTAHLSGDCSLLNVELNKLIAGLTIL